MSDLLGEALAWYDKHTPNGAISQMDTILVAARNWHTLTTNPNYDAAEAVIRALPHHSADYIVAYLGAVVDALTDTAEPDDNLPDVKSRWYANTTEPE